MLVDGALRQLLDAYVELAGATLTEIGTHRVELRIPAEDRALFGRRSIVRLAFSLEALQDDPSSEMAVIGSAFSEQLIAAVRRRGTTRVFGKLPASLPLGAEDVGLPAPVENGGAGPPSVAITHHAVGRLTARVAIRAGAALSEHLVDSGLFDLVTGLRLPGDVAAACEQATAAGSVGRTGDLELRPAGELVTLMLSDLEQALAPEIERQRVESDRALAHELARIDRYFRALLDESAGSRSDIPNADARRAVEREHDRRRQEEISRHEVRAIVHPAQLAEWAVPVQRAEWPLTSNDGHHGTLIAERALVGAGGWVVACPACGASTPSGFLVCHEEHTGCSECTKRCSVCGTGFCRDHGLAACHVDGAPACSDHARTCISCRGMHCSVHEGTCADGEHSACTSCLGACAHCGRVICDAHATQTSSAAPRGARRLCAACVRFCEGGTREVVGPDEVTRCTSCERVVCERHQVTCAVDGHVHCSTHMRRTDRSRRLVCEHDRAACAYEPNAIFAIDEVWPCATCGKTGCAQHLGTCVEDGQRHCASHLAALRDKKGALACREHRTLCHVDGVAFSVTGTEECPACERRACAQHRARCATCGRAVCASDYDRQTSTCVTCRRLTSMIEPDDLLLHAANSVLADGARPKQWRVARDASHRIVELDLGWTRRVVFALRHGADAPDLVVRHSIFGSRATKH